MFAGWKSTEYLHVHCLFQARKNPGVVSSLLCLCVGRLGPGEGRSCLRARSRDGGGGTPEAPPFYQRASSVGKGDSRLPSSPPLSTTWKNQKRRQESPGLPWKFLHLFWVFVFCPGPSGSGSGRELIFPAPSQGLFVNSHCVLNPSLLPGWNRGGGLLIAGGGTTS